MDKQDWRAFFRQNKYHTTMEQAQLAGVSIRTIQRWKKKTGILGKGNGWGNHHEERPFNGVRHKKLAVQSIPRELLTEKWLRETYEERGIGIHTIARMVNRDIATVRGQLRRFNIPMRKHSQAVRSTNPCCTREWLEEHYVVLGKSIRACAQLAEVSRYTIYNWLVKFSIPIRDKYECAAGELSPWFGNSSHGRHKNRTGKEVTKTTT